MDPGEHGLAGIVVQLDGAEVPIPAAATQSAGGRGRGGRGGAASAPANNDGEDVANAGRGPATATATGPATARGGRGRGGPAPVATATRDRTPWEDPATHPLSPGLPDYNNYTVEVVQRIGFDSFCPDSGVLIAKNKDRASSTGGPNAYNIFNWVIDAHPEDINKIDFKRPNGEAVMRTIADYRQLNDALFHAGLNSGSQCEWEDTPNRLHFYIVDMQKDAQGVLSYTLAVRSLDGAGPQTRGVALKAAAPATIRAVNTPCTFELTNIGKPAATPATLHPQDASALLTSDVYRLSVSVDGGGWTAQLENGLAAVKFGEMRKVPVFVSHGARAAKKAIVTLTATSESDPGKTITATCSVTAS